MNNVLFDFTIPLRPITKKNSSRIVKCGEYCKVLPSKQFEKYQMDCGWFIKPPAKPINCKCNIKAVYYMPTKRKVDITNLHNALHDILVYYKVIEDDNCKVVISTDGSRVRVDKDNPRTEIIITKVDEITGFEM